MGFSMMSRGRVWLMGSLLLAGLLGAGAMDGEAETVAFRFRPVKGEGHRFESALDRSITSTSGAQQDRYEEKLTFHQSNVVTGTNAKGLAIVRTIYDRVVAEVKATRDGEVTTVRYDSQTPPPEVPLGARGYAACMGRPVRAKTNQRSEVVEVDADELLTAVWKAHTPAEEQTEEGLRSFLRRETEEMVENYNSIASVLPAAPMKVGEAWTHKSRTLIEGVWFAVETRATLEEYKNGVARFEFESKAAPAEKQDRMDLVPGARIKGSGSARGQLEVTPSGWLKSFDQRAEYEVEIARPGGGDPVKIVQRTRVVTREK